MADYKYGFLLTLVMAMLLILPNCEAFGVDNVDGTTWAVLVAGSNGFINYRHQADVCHAYQILKRGGLKEENIIVFMYDDIAHDELNPRPGTIINHPLGLDVYHGVPRDYTGKAVTRENLFAVILGDKDSVKNGSGKVVDSGPNDRIFIFYTDHGASGILGMPDDKFIYADQFIHVLTKKHKAGTYKEMVIYVEACESGSIFEGLLPDDMNIYVQTAADATENSFATYCPGEKPAPPKEYKVCLGDLYSVSWMEDSDTHNLKNEAIQQQYKRVRNRTSSFSHVMEYGTKKINQEKVYLYQGFNSHSKHNQAKTNMQMGTNIDQREADLLLSWQMYKSSSTSSEKKTEILNQIRKTMAQRNHIDNTITMVGNILFEPAEASSIFNSKRKSGLPLVDDWDCLRSMVDMFESHCGPLTQYGRKYMRAFGNICNNGVTSSDMEDACMTVCSSTSA